MNWKHLFILVCCFIVYLVIGALIFSALESEQEEQVRLDLRQFKEDLLQDLQCLTEETMEDFIAKIVEAVDSGITPYGNVTSKSNWDFSSSFFFSGTVVTTIGYGNLTPVTRLGRSACILYALIGIPLFGIVLVALSDKLKKYANQLEKKLNKKYSDYHKSKSLVYSLLLFVVGMMFFILIPAAIIAEIEGWWFRDAIYYAFITLTTIGFGDFVIGSNPKIEYSVLYKFCTCGWILIGLAFLGLMISFITDIFTSTAKKVEQQRAEMRSVKESTRKNENREMEMLEYKENGDETKELQQDVPSVEESP